METPQWPEEALTLDTTTASLEHPGACPAPRPQRGASSHTLNNVMIV